MNKISIGIYDHAFHFAGGGQRYVAKMAESIQERYDITYISNKASNLNNYKKWFNIDLSGCQLKTIKLPYYEILRRYFVDEGAVILPFYNPFKRISEESLKYQIFINVNMLTKVKPLSPVSIFFCHFPDRQKSKYFFYVDKYTFLVSNGLYSSFWIKKRWGLEPTHIIYPPVDMYNKASSIEGKENIILSVARFEIGGSKKQIEMVKAFENLIKIRPDLRETWRLILAGGSFPSNPYLKKVKDYVNTLQLNNIEIKPDLSFEELSYLYAKSAIFWHACGLNETNPHLVEHFGMTTVEAMQNYVVPVVIDGGGQKEIVEHNKSGFRFNTLDELVSYTLELIHNEKLRKEMAINAYKRSHLFNADVFKEKIDKLFDEVEKKLKKNI
mgnify:CR=1 FL=1